MYLEKVFTFPFIEVNPELDITVIVNKKQECTRGKNKHPRGSYLHPAGPFKTKPEMKLLWHCVTSKTKHHKHLCTQEAQQKNMQGYFNIFSMLRKSTNAM